MRTELNVLRPADRDSWYSVFLLAFGGTQESPEERELWDTLIENDRCIGAWDGDRCVGTTGAFSFRVTVPGGAEVPAAGVTMVSVAATHRRRGILTSMMRRQLDDVRALGEPLAILTASEPAIYGRYGYGVATRQLSAEIDTSRVTLSVPAGTDDVRLRFAAPQDVVEECEALYARACGSRPGMIVRSPGWERLPLLDLPSEREGGSPLQCVVAERDAGIVGYTRFHIKPAWDAAGPRGAVVVKDIGALDPAAHAALWRFLCGVDLTSTVRVRNRPLDDPWQYLVSDIRRCGLQVRDVLHVRLVEVGAALEARTYQAPVDLVFDVVDDFCPWNSGTWRLTGDVKGASCGRVDEPADLALSVKELAAAYLGGTPLSGLAAAGLVRELRQGAVAEASLAFGSDVAPWLPHGF